MIPWILVLPLFCGLWMMLPKILQPIVGIQQHCPNGECQRGKKRSADKISDGMLISFQGHTLHHGTTICQNSVTGKLCPPGDIYGIHFGLSMPTLTSFWCIQIDQYI